MTWFGGYGTEVELKERTDFLKIMETLTRMGVEESEGVLIQSCHILHKKGRYAIMHHNEMHALDGDKSRLTDVDRHQRETVTRLLSKWGLVKPTKLDNEEPIDLGELTVIHHDEKPEWKLETRYTMGKKAK